jgi:hypothetical protein
MTMRQVTISAFVVLLVAIAGPAGAATINVPADYLTIEAAIAAAGPGDTVNVAAGTYTPAGGRLIIDRSITVQGDPDAPTLPRINTNCALWTACAIQIAADNVVFQRFEVDNSAARADHLGFYIVGDYGGAKNGWTVRGCDIHNGRNCIRPVGDNVTIEYNNLHETESDLVNAEYGNCYGLKVSHNWLHSHHSDLGGKPAGVTYNCSSAPGADVEISYNYCWACRTFVDFQSNGGLVPANRVVVAHNTVDYWIGDLPDPIIGSENAQQMSLAWWSGAGYWNGPNFEIRDNLFTRQKWYEVVDTDTYLQGAITLQKNMFWQWYLNDTWYPAYAYPNEWPGPRGAVGWDNMGEGNEFVMTDCVTADPLYAATGSDPDEYYALSPGSPACNAATDGTNIGAWQGSCGQPPEITCLNPTVVTHSDPCEADVDCEAIALCSDPDGDPTTMSCAPPSPYPPGTTSVGVTCDDGTSTTTADCQVTVICGFECYDINEMKIKYEKGTDFMREVHVIGGQLKTGLPAPSDPVRLVVEGYTMLDIPFSAFRVDGDWVYTTPKGVKPKIELRFKTNRCEWTFHISQITDPEAVFDLSDGLSVDLSIGDKVGHFMTLTYVVGKDTIKFKRPKSEWVRCCP